MGLLYQSNGSHTGSVTTQTMAVLAMSYSADDGRHALARMIPEHHFHRSVYRICGCACQPLGSGTRSFKKTKKTWLFEESVPHIFEQVPVGIYIKRRQGKPRLTPGSLSINPMAKAYWAEAKEE